MTQGEANAAWHYAAGGGVGYFTQDGEIHLPPEVVAQWRAEDPVVRSCALNTLAHEIAHTVSVSPFVFTPAFTDTSLDTPRIPGRRPGESPIGSYLIGSAAQCAWLARQCAASDPLLEPRSCIFDHKQLLEASPEAVLSGVFSLPSFRNSIIFHRFPTAQICCYLQ